MLPLLFYCWGGCCVKAQEPRATVKTHGCHTGLEIPIGILLMSCNYTTEIQSYCSGFNKSAITQATIIIKRTIKQGGYSLVKCSPTWRPHDLLRTLANRGTKTWAKTDGES